MNSPYTPQNKKGHTTAKKQLKPLYTMVAKMQTALKNPEPKPQEMLFAQNIENLSIIMNLIEKERTSKPDWRDILIENLKACMPSNNKKIILYHFKIIAELSNSQMTVENLNGLLKRYEYDAWSVAEDALNVKQYQVCYKLVKNQNQRTRYLIEKTSNLVCSFFSSLKMEYESIYYHYTCYCSPLKNKTIFLAAVQYYLRFIYSLPKNFEPHYNPFAMIRDLFALYKEEENLKDLEKARLFNICSYFIELMRRPIFIQWLKIQKIQDQVIAMIQRMDDNDERRSLKLLVLVFMSTRTQNQFMNLPDIFTYKLKADASLLEMLEYVASAHYSLTTLKKDVNSSVLVKLNEVIKHNFGLIIKSGRIVNLELMVESILFEMNRNLSVLVLPDINLINFNNLAKIDKDTALRYLKWLPYLKLQNYFHNITNHKKSLYVTNCEFLMIGYIIIHILNGKKETMSQVFKFMSETYVPSLIGDTDQVRNSIFKTIHVFCRMSIGKFDQISYRCIREIVRVHKLNKYLGQSKDNRSIFQGIVQIKEQMETFGQLNERSCIFASKIVSVLMREMIRSYDQSGISADMCNKRNVHLSEGLLALGYFYHQIQDEQLEQILEEIVGICENQLICRKITTMLEKHMFRALQNCFPVKFAFKNQLFQNLLDCYRDIHLKKEGVTKKEKIRLVNFCFNLKSQLITLFSRFREDDVIRKQIHTINDEIDGIEMSVLGKSAQKYINQMSNSIKVGQNKQFGLSVAIILKSLYYLIYQKKLTFAFTVSTPKQQQNCNRDANGAKQQANMFNFEQQLQESASRMKLLKDRCRQLLPILTKNSFQTSVSISIPHLTHWEIDNVVWDYNLMFQLDDLMYVAYLCELREIQFYLMQLRLSLILKQFGLETLLLQLSRYVFLQFFNAQVTRELKEWIGWQLQQIHQTNLTNMSKLLLGIDTVPTFSNEGRFHKIFFLLNQNPMVYLSNFRQLIKYMNQYVFSTSQISVPVDREHILLKMSNKQQPWDLGEMYWLRGIWESGWTALRLMVQIINAVLKKVMDINETSRVKPILKFAQLVLIRSGHLADLWQPLSLMLSRKETLNVLSVVDSLKKVSALQISHSHYKLIDSLICNKRRSASIGLSVGKLCRLVQQSFQNAGRIGELLAEIFCYLIAEQLGVNAWQIEVERHRMSIFSADNHGQTMKLHKRSQGKDIALKNEIGFNLQLAKDLPRVIFDSYQRASIIRDYISIFIDQAIENMKDLSAEENQTVDRIIGIVALTFEEYNFTFKRFCSDLPSFSFRECSLTNLVQTSKLIWDECNELRQKAWSHIQGQLIDLQKSNLFPASIIFPLGQYLYNIAWKGRLLVTFIKKYEFEDKLQVVQSLIKSNNDLLKNWKNTSRGFLGSKRQGLDRELGKVAFNIDLGIMEIDESLIPNECVDTLSSIHPNLVKFLLYDVKSISHHLAYFVIRNHINLDTSVLMRKLQEVNRKIQDTNARENLLLFIHYKYLSFPFELTKSVRISKGVYRIPSIQYMIENRSKVKEYNIRNCKFLVNTQGDLVQTQNRFEKIRSKFDSWVGIKGRIPPVDELKHLFNQDVYLYMGHGSGLDHIEQSILSMFQIRCLLLVFGCSSAQMIFDESQPYGCAFQLLLRNCPAYLGCLWTVTDCDIDKITQYIFENREHSNLSQILESAKPKCLLPYMNGSSLVIYGMPSYLVR